jgi:cardiolipin synthase
MADSSSHMNPMRTAPNLLTLLRICLAPFLVAAILENQYKLGFGLFLIAGLTDALDGALARMLHQRSILGQYLDPVADKLLLSTLFLVLLHKNLIPTTVTVLVFGRDVGILLVSAILYAAVGRREFHPSIFGKANTLAQIAAVAAVLLSQHGIAARGNSGRQWLLGPLNEEKSNTSEIQPVTARSRTRPKPLLFQRILRSPYRGTLRSQRPRHTPGTQQTLCLRAGRLFEPWGVCRRLPSFF